MVCRQWTLSHFRWTCYISPEKVSSTTENAAVLIIESTSPVRQDWTGSGWPTTSQSNMTPWLQLQLLTCSGNLKQREVLCLFQSEADFCWIRSGSCVILWIRPIFILQTADKCTITSVFYEALCPESHPLDRTGWVSDTLSCSKALTPSALSWQMSLECLSMDSFQSFFHFAFQPLNGATFGANILFIS